MRHHTFNNVSILHRFRYIINLFTKSKNELQLEIVCGQSNGIIANALE